MRVEGWSRVAWTHSTHVKKKEIENEKKICLKPRINFINRLTRKCKLPVGAFEDTTRKQTDFLQCISQMDMTMTSLYPFNYLFVYKFDDKI
jgi:hypothetical protein